MFKTTQKVRIHLKSDDGSFEGLLIGGKRFGNMYKLHKAVVLRATESGEMAPVDMAGLTLIPKSNVIAVQVLS